MYGEKGRIGLLRPGVTPSTEMDFHRYIPEGIAISTCAIPYRQVTTEGLGQMSEQVRAFAALYRGFPVDLLVFACTTGSMVGGPGFDNVLIREMEDAAGIPSITTSTALLQAFSRMGIRRVSIVTPYSDALNEMEVNFLKAAGIETTCIRGLGIEDVTALPLGNRF